MLKNVAIPLMLAASEAEAQRAPTAGEIEEAMRGDRAKEFAGLQAPEDACTVSSSKATDGIANAAQAVTNAKTALETAEKAVAAATAATGAWGKANAAREAAVGAAVAEEANADIAALLDKLDTAAEEERAAAAAYLAADRLYQEGLLTAAAEGTRNTAAIKREGELKKLSDDAAKAVTDAKAQAAKEDKWRGWRYCELGDVVAGAKLKNAAATANWWQMLDGTVPATLPPNCVVPAVNNAAGTQIRPAVTHYTATSGLAAEQDDGIKVWTAKLRHTQAEAAEAKTGTAINGQARNKATEVLYYTEELKANKWVYEQRQREQTFWSLILADAAKAKTEAAKQATNASHVTADPVDANQALLGLTKATDGATKVLGAKATARDSQATGSGIRMAGARGNVTANTGMTTFTINAASMDTWTAVTGVANGVTHKFWVAARAVSEKADAWHTHYTANKAKITPGDNAFGFTAVGTNKKCDTSSIANGTWAAQSNVADLAACKTKCQEASRDAILVDPDTGAGATPASHNNGGGGTANNASKVMGKYTGAATYCAAYSFDNAGGANQKCYLATGNSATVPVPSDTGADAGATTGCFKLTGTDIKDFWTKQNDLQSAYATFKASSYKLTTDMAAEMVTQAGLEKAWLDAYYTQQYWVALDLQFNPATASTNAKAFSDLKAVADNNAATAGSVANAKGAMDTSESNLTTATTALAALQATTAAAKATMDDLAARILKADTQIAELDALANAGATGTLDLQAAKRLADYNAYKNDGSAQGSVKGEFKLAADAKAAADALVKARSAADKTDGGKLVEDRATAQKTWDDAKLKTSAAEKALTDKLSGKVLVDLRKKVEDDTAEWDKEQKTLEGLEKAVTDAEGTLAAAEKTKDQKVLACQIAAYDDYREALENAMVKRAADLKAIKALLEKELTRPAPGTKGARCEKALSNGTYRPARGELTCAEGLCCGAARVWMASGGTPDAAWRTIETCQPLDTKKYTYTKARSPMSTDAAAARAQEVDFVCIEGAKKLAAAASAVAAAVYMLA